MPRFAEESTAELLPEEVGRPERFLSAGTNAARLRPMLEDPDNVARIKRDTMPIPVPRQRIGYYGNDHLAYWLSGLSDLRWLRKRLGENAAGPVLDFGAASGRVARHWAMEPEAFAVTACDTTERLVNWLDAHAGGRINAICNDIAPPLSVPDGTFGLVYAYSVFTHIFELEDAWLAELRRVTRPGAHLALTIHSEATWDAIPTLKFRIKDKLEQIPAYVALRESGAVMPDRLHFEHEQVHYVFYSTRHIHTAWGRYFEIVEIVHNAHNYQSMVIMRRPG